MSHMRRSKSLIFIVLNCSYLDRTQLFVSWSTFKCSYSIEIVFFVHFSRKFVIFFAFVSHIFSNVRIFRIFSQPKLHHIAGKYKLYKLCHSSFRCIQKYHLSHNVNRLSFYVYSPQSFLWKEISFQRLCWSSFHTWSSIIFEHDFCIISAHLQLIFQCVLKLWIIFNKHTT